MNEKDNIETIDYYLNVSVSAEMNILLKICRQIDIDGRCCSFKIVARHLARNSKTILLNHFFVFHSNIFKNSRSAS